MALWLTSALAATPEQVQDRLAEVEPMRASRIVRSAPTMSSSDIHKAAGGQIVSGTVGDRAYGAQLMKLPISLLWSAINDETRHPGYTAIAYSELLSGAVCTSGRRVLQYLPVPMVSDRWWIGVLTINHGLMRDSGGSVREVAWRSSTDANEVTTESGRKIISKATPIGSSQGGWFLVAVDERSTYLEYYSRSDPGAGVPTSIANRLAARGVRENFAAIARFAREGNPSCPIR